jgi:LysR family glycine cleavage system transcriptional activator
MNAIRHRPLSVGPIRAFEAVARHLSFRAAADELHLTQSAVSRQIKSLEDELGAALFSRGTRSVEITNDGQALLRAVINALDRLDGAVRQIRQSRGRRRVSVNTFASFASLWLIPRLEPFQRENPDMDIRLSATDMVVELDDPEIDIVLRYCGPEVTPAGAVRLFGEVLTPVISPWLAEQIERGQAPPLRTPADLSAHTLAEEDDNRPTAEYLSWRRWLRLQGLPNLEPRRWMYLNFTYQQVQAALAGQAMALARVALVSESLQRGDLVEPFGAAGRIGAPSAFWMIVSPQAAARPEVKLFRDWLVTQASLTRQVLGESP